MLGQLHFMYMEILVGYARISVRLVGVIVLSVHCITADETEIALNNIHIIISQRFPGTDPEPLKLVGPWEDWETETPLKCVKFGTKVVGLQPKSLPSGSGPATSNTFLSWILQNQNKANKWLHVNTCISHLLFRLWTIGMHKHAFYLIVPLFKNPQKEERKELLLI